MPVDSCAFPLIVLTGISAAGKTTIGRLLADAFPRGAFVEGDQVREMVRNGRVDMSQQPSPAAIEQLRLRYRQSAALADSFHAAGFATVVEDVIIGPELLTFLAALRTRPVHLVVLDPSAGAVQQRESGRAKDGYRSAAGDSDWVVDALQAVLRSQTPRLGLWLDSSAQTPEQTAQAILARLDQSALPESALENARRTVGAGG